MRIVEGKDIFPVQNMKTSAFDCVAVATLNKGITSACLVDA